MVSSAVEAVPGEELLYRDGLGDRLLVRDTAGRPLHELLLLRAELSAVPSFEFALNQRLTQLESFNDPSFVRARGAVRVPGGVPRVSVISDHSGGTRLAEVLRNFEVSGKPFPTSAALFVLKEILGSLALFHRHGSDISHGALALERIVLADGKVRITDYVFGSAIEQLRFPADRYWKELRVAVPSAAGGTRFDKQVDIAQVGMIAVSLFASRPLGDSDQLGTLGGVLMGLTQQVGDERSSLAPALRTWLLKALHMDLRRTFVSAAEAEQSLTQAMAEAGIRASSPDMDIVGGSPRVKTTVTIRTAPAAVPPPIKRPQPDAWKAAPSAPAVRQRFPTVPAEPSRASRRMKGILQIGLVGTFVAGAFAAAQFIPAPSSLFPGSGTLVIESKPAGVPLLVDGEPQGVTPLTLQVTSGRHEVELRGAGKPRVFNIWVSKGERVSQYVELQPIRTRK